MWACWAPRQQVCAGRELYFLAWQLVPLLQEKWPIRERRQPYPQSCQCCGRMRMPILHLSRMSVAQPSPRQVFWILSSHMAPDVSTCQRRTAHNNIQPSMFEYGQDRERTGLFVICLFFYCPSKNGILLSRQESWPTLYAVIYSTSPKLGMED